MCLPSLENFWTRLTSPDSSDMVTSTCTWGKEGGYNYNIGFTRKKRRRYSPSPFAGYGGRRSPMSKDNPGAWPDQGEEDERVKQSDACGLCGYSMVYHRIGDDACPLMVGNDLEFAEGTRFTKTASPSPPVPVGPLYTAAEMKAARVETVERCKNALLRLFHTLNTTKEEEVFVNGAVLTEIEKLKEEIENENGN